MRLLAHELCKDIDLTFQGSFQVNWSWNLTNYHDEHFCSLGEFDTSVKLNRTTWLLMKGSSASLREKNVIKMKINPCSLTPCCQWTLDIQTLDFKQSFSQGFVFYLCIRVILFYKIEIS